MAYFAAAVAVIWMVGSGKIETRMSFSLGVTSLILNYAICKRSNTMKDIHQERKATTRFEHIKNILKNKGMMNSTVNLVQTAASRSANWLYNKGMEFLEETNRSTRSNLKYHKARSIFLTRRRRQSWKEISIANFILQDMITVTSAIVTQGVQAYGV